MNPSLTRSDRHVVAAQHRRIARRGRRPEFNLDRHPRMPDQYAEVRAVRDGPTARRSAATTGRCGASRVRFSHARPRNVSKRGGPRDGTRMLQAETVRRADAHLGSGPAGRVTAPAAVMATTLPPGSNARTTRPASARRARCEYVALPAEPQRQAQRLDTGNLQPRQGHRNASKLAPGPRAPSPGAGSPTPRPTSPRHHAPLPSLLFSPLRYLRLARVRVAAVVLVPAPSAFFFSVPALPFARYARQCYRCLLPTPPTRPARSGFRVRGRFAPRTTKAAAQGPEFVVLRNGLYQWRRRELNPRPRSRKERCLRAYPVL